MKRIVAAAWMAMGAASACGGAEDGSGPGGSGASAGASNTGGSGAGNTGSGASSTGTTGAGATTGAGGTAAPCGSFQTGNAFEVCSATYLTGAGDDQAGGVDIAPDGTVVYGGSIHPDDFGVEAASLLGGGAAGIVRLSSDGRKVLGVTRLGASVTDVAVAQGGGEIAVSGDFGVAVFDATGSSVKWNVSGSSAAKVAITSDGVVAGLFGKELRIFDSEGKQLGSAMVSTNQSVNDITIDGASKMAFATGFKQDDGAPCTQLQIPFVRAYGFDGSAKWKAYDWNKAEAGAVSDCADSRGYALAMGRDGKLYFGGESHGGNTVFRHLPQNINENAPTVKSDPFNDPYNLNGASPIGFYARFDAATGAIEKGQFVCTRLSSGKGNAARPRSIAADAQGNVVVGGATACCIENGPDKTVNGQPAMPSYAGGGFLLVVNSDFTKRLQWTTFNGSAGGNANGVSVSASSSGIALLMQQNVDTNKNMSTTEIPLLTFDAVSPSPGGGPTDVWLGVMPPAP